LVILYQPANKDAVLESAMLTWVRLRVTETSTRITGMENLSSVEVLVSP
jgi:hypothetical protein